ncbi:DNA cytosine methyltransferase [Acinetobacter baumannii]|uniref:DNA cytosine methyltransferase n=1 Tax=Acinetobacter baumannii TaxID=470 RepID=UPI00028CCCFB|nr:DNA cytosine methyltransferase [Acinetobacter baumannii]EKK12028.1 putative modification methylase HaeIII [Acinetobacter baumannii Naval-72]MDN8330316.1 DNA cytosine methyltransferase [Acinetobacter baumannii]MDN8337456.1 DNA cytosine methyltransferase [Acinetobacter baumannii]
MKVVSLFSGAGGLDLGFINAGFEVVWANDFDEDACKTYAHNIGEHIVHGNISSIFSDTIPECDVVIGGFPCQGFSQANLKRSNDDDRNQLYLEFLRIVTDKKPKYFVAENVRGILSLDGGNAIKKIIDDFKNAGYRIQYQLFNTADYGVPQTRYRVIIIGIRNDLNHEYIFPTPTHISPSKNNPLGLKPWVSISEALKDIQDPEEDDYNLKNHVYSQYKVTNRNFTGHRETDPNKPSPTILARGNGKGGVCAIQHPKNHRRMSIRESALIQTFPMDFEFFGSMTSCYRQVGNAVPVLFAETIAKSLCQE